MSSKAWRYQVTREVEDGIGSKTIIGLSLPSCSTGTALLNVPRIVYLTRENS